MIAAIEREWRRSDRLVALLTVVLGTLAAVVSLQLWAARLDVPFLYWGDALSVAGHFKTVGEMGWYEFQPRLGAPAGQTYHDFPTADNLHFLAASILTALTRDWAVAMNLYFIVGFPLAALSGFWLARKIGVSRAVSVAVGLVFTLAPYHFQRGEGHLWLASYYALPLSLFLVWQAIRGEAIWTRRAGVPWWRSWITLPTLRTLAIVILTGTAQSYYAVFFLVLLAFAGIVRLVRDGDWRRFWGAASAGVATVLVMLANMAPDLLYSAIEGPNPTGFARGHAEAEIYALKLAQLLLPWGGHRIDFLRDLREQYNAAYPLVSENPALGAIAAAGFVIAFLVLAYLAATVLRPRDPETPSTRLLDRLGALGALIFVAYLFSTVGGLSTFISFATTALRGWNRMSIVIGMLCLLVVGLVVDALLARLTARRTARTRAVAGVVAATLLVGVAFVDQTPADPSSRNADVAVDFDADRAYFSGIEAALPPGALVLQLPYDPYPEHLGPTGVFGSDALIPYLHTAEIRWSGGGIKGRARSDWPLVIGERPADEIADLAAIAGFDGILVDRRALPPLDLADLEAGLTDVLGAPRAGGADDRFAFWDLTGLRSDLEADLSESERAAIAADVLEPVIPSFVEGMTLRVDEEGERLVVAVDDGGVLRLQNDRDVTVRVLVDATLSAEGMPEVVIRRGDAVLARLRPEATGTAVSFELEVPPGATDLVFAITGAEPDATATLSDLVVTMPAVAAFTGR